MLSDRAKKIKPSPTLAMGAKAKTMKAEGIDVINFAVGEPDFDTPEHIKQAAIKALKDGFTKYTPVGGINTLKDAIIEKFKKDNNIEYSHDEVVVSCGAKHSLYNIAQSLYNKGDEVIIPVPYWVSYPEQVLLNDATPVFVETHEKDGFVLKPEAFEESITRNTKALILNSPSNPTGLTYDKKSLERIAEIALKNNLHIISDEIYEKLLYDGVSHVSIASLDREVKEKTIVVNSLSKTYAMTGWRVGYAAGNRDIVRAIKNIQSQSTSNPTSIAQSAAVEALTGPQDFIKDMLAEFDKRRKYLVSELNFIPGVHCLAPTGAFYAFPNTSKIYGRKSQHGAINSSSDLAVYLLEAAGAALVPGSAFGNDNYLRISYATSIENIKNGIQRVKEAVGRLK